MSATLQLITLVWEKGKKDTWDRINHSMREALTLAINAGLDFKASDFNHFATKFRWGYWVTSQPEWIYSLAVVGGNKSCIEAWENHKNRPPYFANDVQARSYTSFIHANDIQRQRERLAVGFGFKMEGRVWFVTGFGDGHIRVALYEHDHQTGSPKKLRKIAPEELRSICPAPKKTKKEEEE